MDTVSENYRYTETETETIPIRKTERETLERRLGKTGREELGSNVGTRPPTGGAGHRRALPFNDQSLSATLVSAKSQLFWPRAFHAAKNAKVGQQKLELLRFCIGELRDRWSEMCRAVSNPRPGLDNARLEAPRFQCGFLHYLDRVPDREVHRPTSLAPPAMLPEVAHVGGGGRFPGNFQNPDRPHQFATINAQKKGSARQKTSPQFGGVR